MRSRSDTSRLQTQLRHCAMETLLDIKRQMESTGRFRADMWCHFGIVVIREPDEGKKQVLVSQYPICALYFARHNLLLGLRRNARVIKWASLFFFCVQSQNAVALRRMREMYTDSTWSKLQWPTSRRIRRLM